MRNHFFASTFLKAGAILSAGLFRAPAADEAEFQVREFKTQTAASANNRFSDVNRCF